MNDETQVAEELYAFARALVGKVAHRRRGSTGRKRPCSLISLEQGGLKTKELLIDSAAERSVDYTHSNRGSPSCVNRFNISHRRRISVRSVANSRFFNGSPNLPFSREAAVSTRLRR